jgi:hypothetical protein
MPRHIFAFLFLLSACAPTPQPEQVRFNIYATSAAAPWLESLYACAAENQTLLTFSADSPDIFLRVGEAEMIASPAYQIGEVEILVAAHRENNLQSLTLPEAQDLFTQKNSSAQVWVYPSESDLQRVFDQIVMQGRSVSSSAKIAVSAQNMSEILNSDPASIGILPRQWVTGYLREVFSAGRAPVLALTKEEPQPQIALLIACLRNK